MFLRRPLRSGRESIWETSDKCHAIVNRLWLFLAQSEIRRYDTSCEIYGDP
jgi:hypothetical protein